MVRPIRRLRAVPLIAESIVHHLSPFAIQFSDGVGIRWYGLSYAMGFLVAWMVLRWLARTGRTQLVQPSRTQTKRRAAPA